MTFTCQRSRNSLLASRLLCSSLQPSLSGAAEDCQPVQTKHKIRVLAGKLCLQLCYLLYHPVLLSLTHAHQNALTGTRSENFPSRTHTYMLTSSQAGRQGGRQAGTPPPIISAGSSSAHIGVSSKGLYLALQRQQQQAAAGAGRVQRKAVITRDHTPASTTEGKPPPSFFLFSLLFFISFSLSSFSVLM